MKAMLLEEQGKPLRMKQVDNPVLQDHEILIRIKACGICRTDLHVVDGDLSAPKLPLIPGHQIVGHVERAGSKVKNFYIEDRVGVPWLGGSCGNCWFCKNGKENLCDKARYTGYQIDGGFAEYCAADERFCFPIPKDFSDLQAAPLLCAGLIGYRSYRMTLDAERIGFYGFGAAAHILIQVANYQGKQVYAFTRRGDTQAKSFAMELGAKWVGNSDEPAPEHLDAAIIFAPVGELVPLALKSVRKGGVVVCAGIHMSDIPSFPYSDLWGERIIRSVANLTRKDGEEFLKIAPEIPIKTETHPYALKDVNIALDDLRKGKLSGAAVVMID